MSQHVLPLHDVIFSWCLLSTGVGVIINYMAVWTVFLQNFTVQYGGRAAVAVAVGISSSLSFVSTKTSNIH